MDKSTTDVSRAAAASRRRGTPVALRVLGKLAVGTAWWYGATNLALGYIGSCSAWDSPSMFAAIPVYPLAWITSVVLTWLAFRLVAKAYRRGWGHCLLAVAGVVVVVALITWGYAAFFVSNFSDPIALDRFCTPAAPWWPALLPMP